MKKKLIEISPSFLDSFRYYRSLDVNDQDKVQSARTGLLNRLRGLSTPPTPEQKAGQTFEDTVQGILEGKLLPGYEFLSLAREAADYIGKATYQVPINLHVGNYMINGYIDFLTPNLIIDTKTTKTYKPGKYFNYMQHRVYLEVFREMG